MTILDQLETIRTLWKTVSDVELPTDRVIIRWLAERGYAQLEKTIVKIPWRFRGMEPEADHVHRWVSATMAEDSKRDARVGIRERA